MKFTHPTDKFFSFAAKCERSIVAHDERNTTFANRCQRCNRLEAPNATPDNTKHEDNALRTAARLEDTPLRRILDSGHRYVHEIRCCIRMNWSYRSLIHRRRTIVQKIATSRTVILRRTGYLARKRLTLFCQKLLRKEAPKCLFSVRDNNSALPLILEVTRIRQVTPTVVQW